MKYCRIKPQYDQKRRNDGSILIANELYTEKEAAKHCLPPFVYDVVEVSKRNIYIMFGARFECRNT